MSIRVYRVKIEGYVIVEDFGGPIESNVTPADWDFDQLIVSMSENCNVTETLIDTISDEETP
jgi:hypothetical protein